MAGRPLYHVTPRRPLRAQAAAGGDAAEASGADPAPRREVRFAEPPPPREGGSFSPTRRGEAAAGGRSRSRGRRRRRRGGGAAAGRMVGGSDGQGPPDATELKRRRKSPRLSAARAEEAEAEAAVEPGPGGALEGDESHFGNPDSLTRPPIKACRSAGFTVVLAYR
ncbi:serine/arginine repetitive matrix protein 3-like isoform X5 [Aquila chrysaetos chrysaetos]|uniref:serine/arginine repetitive matrix protein 3-like isoform X5 n=1 Tax=Aquila chrysaetos chrysaetos TaxID=223781 RepID=UPI001176C50A|nr:serine/arginine repetitive matrix protein 3-like isoform X5 [Aquila chrysaetos chrysaetos]